jgi:hypothetical protein|tara:strand:- start:335 stop:742 length:408 start_codon:yes stop_codon:yes gene_type:complete
MLIQYNFTTSLNEIHEVLFDKLKRARNKVEIESTLRELNQAFLEKKDLDVLKRHLIKALEDLKKMEKELAESLAFVSSLQDSLNAPRNEAPQPQVLPADAPKVEKKPMAPSQDVGNLQSSLQTLGKLATSLKNIE